MIELARKAALAGADILTRYLGRAEIHTKAGLSQNLVTQADIESEAAVVEVIRSQFPNHAILGEESSEAIPADEIDLNAEHLWIIDPLDGTTNYAQGIPQFCTAVAYASRGKVTAGAIYDPCRKEMFHAEFGGGAFINDERIFVSQRGSLSEAVIATGFYYDRGEMMRRTLGSIEQLFSENVRGVRRLGAAALDCCWVACGRWEGFFEYQLSPWDYAAAKIIVEEAGGRCLDRTGKPLELGSGNVIITNELLCEDIVKAVAWTNS